MFTVTYYKKRFGVEVEQHSAEFPTHSEAVQYTRINYKRFARLEYHISTNDRAFDLVGHICSVIDKDYNVFCLTGSIEEAREIASLCDGKYYAQLSSYSTIDREMNFARELLAIGYLDRGGTQDEIDAMIKGNVKYFDATHEEVVNYLLGG